MRFDRQTILITGASSGIGLGYAQEFAMRGANLVLVARSSDRLGNLASQLHAQYGITVEPISTDLSVPGAPTGLLERIGQAGHLVDGVVNNAGFGDHGDVGSADPHRLSSMVTLNCTALVELTRATLPRMIANRRGVVVNVASTAAFQPIPTMAVYAATKAFVLSFTEALWDEVRGTGVRVLAISPGGTDTPFFTAANATSTRMTAKPMRSVEQVVATTFRGLEQGRPSIIDGGLNTVLATASRFSPTRLAMMISRAVVAKT